MAHQHYRSPFGDTTYTKLFVGGLAWETPTDEMRSYFEQFGEILEAVIITDKNTGKAKGYGFVTFRDPESARRACADPNPVIDGRRANCNIASLGRPRLSPPRGRNQGGNPNYQGGSPSLLSSSSYSGLPAQLPPPPPVPPIIYPPYGENPKDWKTNAIYQTNQQNLYAPYPSDYGYSQGLYNPQLQQTQYYQQPYGSSSPYFYGYPTQASRGTFPAQQPRRYIYYPTQMDGSFPTLLPPPLHLPLHSLPPRLPFFSPTESLTPQHISTETEVAAESTSEGPKT